MGEILLYTIPFVVVCLVLATKIKTNLGGSLLTALTHSKNYDKDTTRITTAIGYCTFAVFQIATLALTAKNVHVDYRSGAIYVGTGIAVFVVVDLGVRQARRCQVPAPLRGVPLRLGVPLDLQGAHALAMAGGWV